MDIVRYIKQSHSHPIFYNENYSTFIDLLKLLSLQSEDYYFKNIFNMINKKFKFYKKNNSHKLFLTCFIINYFPNDIFNNINFIEKKLIKISSIIINLFKNINSKQSLNLFIKKFQIYILTFNIWKNKDKKKLINLLISTHIDLKNTLTFLTKIKNKKITNIEKVWLQSLQKQILLIEKEINKINGNLNCLKFDNKKFLNIARTAFWDIFKKNLSKTPPDYYQIYSCLNEIKKKINKLTPNRLDFHKEFNNVIDIELIRDLIERNKFTIDYFIEIIKFIYEKRLLKLCSPNMDKDITIFFNNYLENINGKEWSYIIPVIFKDIYNRIELIQKSVETYVKAVKLKFCPNCKKEINIDICIYKNKITIPTCIYCNLNLLNYFIYK